MAPDQDKKIMRTGLGSEISVEVGDVHDLSDSSPGSDNGQGGKPAANELHRNFKARHIQMIALGGCLGSGLFIGTGKALQQGGSGGMLLGYTLICSMALTVMNVLTEHTCLFPTPGSFIDHANRFIDPAVGFACGVTEWTAFMTVMATEGAIVRIVLSYWTTELPTAACMTIYLVIVAVVHSLPNKWFAEFEFGTAAAKVITMLIIIFACIAMASGAGPTNTGELAKNWDRAAEAFPHGFKGVCATFTLAGWATGGQEIMGITAGEAEGPRWDMPRACKNLFIRILLFFELSTILISLLVDHDDPRLLGGASVANSPFVIAMVDAGIKGLPDLINAVVLVGLAAIGAESIYISSRVMTAMSRMGMFPEILGRIDSKGRPRWALLVTVLSGTVCLYINCSSTGGVIFTWFSSISSTVYFMSWLVIGVTNFRMRRSLQLQGDRGLHEPFAYRLRTFPFLPAFLVVSTTMVLSFTAWTSLYPVDGSGPNVYSFFQTLLGVPIWIVSFLGWKLWQKTKVADLTKSDLTAGRLHLTQEQIDQLVAYRAVPWWKRGLTYVRF